MENMSNNVKKFECVMFKNEKMSNEIPQKIPTFYMEVRMQNFL